MKYESELLNEILEKEGHKVPTLHYQSECIESWIEEAKGAYPKLCDYESEWLNYINENPIGEFPYETVTTNSTATVNHVVPFAYKTAILKGQTESIYDRFEQGSYSFSTSQGTKSPTTPSKDRLRIKQPIRGVKGTLTITLNENYEMLTGIKHKNGKVESTSWVTEITKDVVETDMFYFAMRKKDGSVISPNDLYEGVISVTGYDLFEIKCAKMPVLTVTNGNLLILSSNTLKMGSISGDTGEVTQSNTRCHTTNIKVSQNDDLFLKRINCNYKVAVRYYYGDTLVNKNINNHGSFIDDGNLKVKGGEDYDSIKLVFGKSDNSILTIEEATKQQIMLVPNDNYTTYEPHQSNILTVNEDVTLCGIGNVQDELDCLPGEVTQRIGEVVLAGSKNWQQWWHLSKTVGFMLKIGLTGLTSTNSIANSLPFNNINGGGDANDIEGYNFYCGNILIRLNKSKLNGEFTDYSDEQLVAFKNYLSQNPITFQYQLATETIKTVDITVVNQDEEPLSKIKPFEGTMHIEVSGTPLNPTAVLEVPVEAITQNLNSFFGEE